MKIMMGLFFLHIIKTVLVEEIVDTTVTLRKRMTLDCMYSGKETILQSSWFKLNGSFEEQLCAFHMIHGKYFSEKYKGRMSFVVENFSSDMSIILTETAKEDIGIYFCYIALFPKGTVRKVIAVQADDFGKIIPSANQIFAENTTISLNFQYTLGGDVKKVTLEKFKDVKMDTIVFCEKQMTSRTKATYGFDFINRAIVNCSILQNITMFIYQAASMDKGLYKCHFNAGNQSQTIAVNVYLKKGISPLYTVVLMYGGSLVVIIVIVFTATICVIRKWKYKCGVNTQPTPTFNSTHCPIYQNKSDIKVEEHIYANTE
ncbi:CD226 antigen [Pseudophryne corroboree]|uniref:CD226 antigen n=1 Tax=Pseudophryne corroboree TaxID=495146 RepID=UPI003081B572